jgi:hypothetical protein
METALQKIWKAVTGLKQADHQSTAMCYSIINLMIKQGIVTREEATRQIEKSVVHVVSLHKEISEAMRDKMSAAVKNSGMTSLH